MNMINLSAKVKQKRGNLGLRAAADQIGITHTTLSRVESGKLPDMNTFEKLCAWLGMEPNDFFTVSNTALGMAQTPVAHYRAKKTMGAVTGMHLGELITKVHEAAKHRVS